MTFKKAISFITMLLIAALSMFGQSKEMGGDRVGGVRAGWHYAAMELKGAKPDTANALNSFYVGFFRDTRIIPMLHFGSGIEYFQNGMEYSENRARILHTLSVPLNLKVKLGPVFARAGLAANFKIAERQKIGGEYIKPLESDLSNWFDVPAFLGAGLDIWFITVEARYHWGLLEVRNGYYNQYFQLGAGISF
jgi:hypothetical protein